MSILITGARVIDPDEFDAVADIWVEKGKIAAVEAPGKLRERLESSKIQREEVRIIDAAGKLVCPGLIDMHVHLREPGYEHKETIDSGTKAAAYGGFTAVCCMANTNPVNDSRAVTEWIIGRGRAAGFARVYPVAAVTKALAGQTLVDFADLRDAGAVAFSDDGNPVTDSGLMRSALQRAAAVGRPVISHCEDPALAANGCMNAGPTAGNLGMPGIPNASESVMVERDIALSAETGAAVHIAHVSTAESVDAIRAAKDRGLAVTAETAPHYFSLTDETVRQCGSNAKMNPPLRSEADRQAIRRGLADGTIDVIATDHAPHTPEEKSLPFERAPNGIIGLETALGLSLRLAAEGVLSDAEVIAKLSRQPARILGLPCGLKRGLPADIAVIDPQCRYTVDAARFQSKSRNTPFQGWQMTGRAILTMVAGRIVFEAAGIENAVA